MPEGMPGAWRGLEGMDRSGRHGQVRPCAGRAMAAQGLALRKSAFRALRPGIWSAKPWSGKAWSSPGPAKWFGKALWQRARFRMVLGRQARALCGAGPGSAGPGKARSRKERALQGQGLADQARRRRAGRIRWRLPRCCLPRCRRTQWRLARCRRALLSMYLLSPVLPYG